MTKKGRPKEYDNNAICFRCGIKFKRYPGKQKHKRTFCGRECYNLQMAEENLLKRVNQKGGLTEKEKEKIRKKHLGKGEGVSYEKTYGRHTHRVVAEQKIGRPLKTGEVVHHIDSNIRNNHPDNLMVFESQSEHLNWHKENDPKYKGGGQFHG